LKSATIAELHRLHVMELVATPDAIAFVEERGGRLFVWKAPGRC
jgi:hypothetical protein